MRGATRFIALTVLTASATFAAPAILTSGSSIVTIEDVNAGVDGWTIGGGPSHAFYEAFLFRLGDSGPASLLGALGAPTIVQPTADLVTYTYGGAAVGFEITVRYLLTGNGISGDLAEAVRIRNLGNQPLNIDLFEYDDWDMGGTIGGDTLYRLNSSTMRQIGDGATVTVGATGIPDHFEMGSPASVSATLFAAGFTDLDDVDDTPLTGNDLAWAWQWDFVIAAGSEAFISKDKILVVPEPATMLTLSGLFGLAILRRRKKA